VLLRCSTGGVRCPIMTAFDEENEDDREEVDMSGSRSQVCARKVEGRE
jgi:hypothetical protein